MACDPVRQSCPSEAAETVDSSASDSVENQPAAESVLPSDGSSAFISAPRADQVLEALSSTVLQGGRALQTLPSGQQYHFAPIDRGPLHFQPADPIDVSLSDYRRGEAEEVVTSLKGGASVVAVVSYRAMGKSNLGRVDLPLVLSEAGLTFQRLHLNWDDIKLSIDTASSPNVLILDEAPQDPTMMDRDHWKMIQDLLQEYIAKGGKVILLGGGDYITPTEQLLWMGWFLVDKRVVTLDIKPLNFRQAWERLIPPDSALPIEEQAAYVRLVLHYVPPYLGPLGFYRLKATDQSLEVAIARFNQSYRFGLRWESEGVATAHRPLVEPNVQLVTTPETPEMHETTRTMREKRYGNNPPRSIEATRAFLESWPHPVAAGVRYPVLDRETAWKVQAEVVRFNGRQTTTVTTTNFGRHWRQLIAFQDWLRSSGRTGSFRALVVGAGFAPTIESVRTVDEGKFPPESIAVLEYAALLDQAGLDFQLDVVDPLGEIEAYFKTLGQKEAHTFIVHDNPSTNPVTGVPATFAPRIFGRHATEIPLSDDIPSWADHAWRVTLPRRVLERIRFIRGNVLAPLPGTSYDLIDYHNVWMHLPRDLHVPTHFANRLLSIDLANLVLNLKPRGWLMTGEELDDHLISHDVFHSSRVGYVYQVYGVRVNVPVMERQPDGSWRLVRSSGDNDSGPTGGGEVSYRGPADETPRRHDGSELLGVGSALAYPGEIVPSTPSNMVRGGLELDRGIAPEVSGAVENALPRLPRFTP
ncbi:MAG: hypothetical protein Q7S98_01085 [Deltaproteobacteria bacterium]|nr:hypothetical protein [Deltaproteobacteria bacterium]